MFREGLEHGVAELRDEFLRHWNIPEFKMFKVTKINHY
jgi:hypothetical protein